MSKQDQYEHLHEVWCELTDCAIAKTPPDPDTIWKLNQVLKTLEKELEDE